MTRLRLHAGGAIIAPDAPGEPIVATVPRGVSVPAAMASLPEQWRTGTMYVNEAEERAWKVARGLSPSLSRVDE